MSRQPLVLLAGIVALSIPSPATARSSSPPPPRVEPVRVLLLDYHAPDEHDVLQSFLCVEPCTASRGCPAALRRSDVDSWSPDFTVWRPEELGETADVVVEGWKAAEIDLLSLSGHHASGFSGELDRGRFDTELLAEQLEEVEEAEDFFTRPSLVLLQGCRTDVSAEFAGDPLEYVLHVVEETRVRGHEFDRLFAAVQQLGGVQKAYRDLFPNACLLGYRGSQAPGGRVEIYGQIDRWLRALAATLEGGDMPAARVDLSHSVRAREARELAQRVEAECPSGWPCNLCDTDEVHYRPLAQALATWLRAERVRIHGRRSAPFGPTVRRNEAEWESASYYANTTWSCPRGAPVETTVYPEPVDESPFAKLFLDLMLLDPLPWTEAQQNRLERELVHRLGWIEITAEAGREIRNDLEEETRWGLFRTRILERTGRMSTFRQRDLFTFLARIGCSRCFREVLGPDRRDPSPVVRENAAAQWTPDLGVEILAATLIDPEPRIRRLAEEMERLWAANPER